MRNEKEMFDLILGVAMRDERIRAVYMNGSRTNPNVPKDIFQDYDIVYVVTEVDSFVQDPDWISVFGERIMLQEPDKNNQSVGLEMTVNDTYGYLMLFKDGNRIDLRLHTKEGARRTIGKDPLVSVLLDKDHLLPDLPPSTDEVYHVKKPTESRFLSCCNNFWWCLQNVAKGIWRDELPYAKCMLEEVVRTELNQIVAWWIGADNDFHVSAGKMGKYFKRGLPEAYWNQYQQTYANGNYDELWTSIFVMCDLFRQLAVELAEKFSFTYPMVDDQNMTQYLNHIRNLPSDATEIY